MLFPKIKENEKKFIINENLDWFEWFVIFPKWLTIFFAAVFVVAGIIVSISNEEGIYLLPFWLGGAILCSLIYCVSKIFCSYKILHIYLLESIFSKINSLDSGESNEPEVLPEI